MKNTKVVLNQRPEGALKESDMVLVEETLPALEDGEVLLEVEHLSVDAFIRTTFDEGAFHGTADLGQPIMALGTARVVDSRFDGLNQGDAVFGPMGAQTHAKLPGAMLQKLDESELPARSFLGVLGLATGMTAYAGMTWVAEVSEGDTVVVSAAADAVGSCACQVAKNLGARVIGIAGGPAKVNYLVNEIGCDAAIDYKAGDLEGQLSAAAPDGVDVFFDNVGGEILDTLLLHINERARVVICGAVSQYERTGDVRGPSNYLKIPEKNASMLGFTVMRFAERYPEIQSGITDWVLSGKLKLPEQVENGIDQFPRALTLLFSGGHMGKLLVAP